VVAVFASLLALSLAQKQTFGPWLKPWLIGLAVVLYLLFSFLILAAAVEVSGWWRTRKLGALLTRGETLTEQALRIPGNNRDRVLDFWRKYDAWTAEVLTELKADEDRVAFRSVDLGKPPDEGNFLPLAQDQRLEVAGGLPYCARLSSAWKDGLQLTELLWDASLPRVSF